MISEDDEEVSNAEEMRLYTINEGGSSISGSSVSNITSLAKKKELTSVKQS